MHKTLLTVLTLLASAASTAAQVVVQERADGSSDLLSLTPAGSQLALSGIELRDCQLVGYAVKDALRASFPRPSQVADLPHHIMLPSGGSLWRAQQGPEEILLQITSQGTPRVLLRAPAGSPAGSSGIASHVAVSQDGHHVLASANGAVWQLDALNGGPAVSLTGHLGALATSPKSLRINHDAAFFVANDALYRSPSGSVAQRVSIPLGPEEEICEELVAANSSGTVLAMLETSDFQRRLVAVSSDGSLEWLVATNTALPVPGLDEDLGPFIAIAPNGTRAAWRTEGTQEELFLVCLEGGIPQQVTTTPEYPAYVDNIGVLSFGVSNVLCFFAGDRVLSGITEADLMGAADMYAVAIDSQCGLRSRNVSGTSGSLTPPFELPGTMTLEKAINDPLGQRFFVAQEPDEDEEFLSTFAVTSVPGQSGYGSSDLLIEHEDFTFYPMGGSTLVVTEHEHGSEEDMVISFLAPLASSGPQSIELGSWSEGTVVEQVTSFGTSACLRLRTPSGPEVYWLELETGELRPVLPAVVGGSLLIDRPVTFNHLGQLITGAFAPSGRHHWFRVDRPLDARLLRVAARSGFALPY